MLRHQKPASPSGDDPGTSQLSIEVAASTARRSRVTARSGGSASIRHAPRHQELAGYRLWSGFRWGGRRGWRHSRPDLLDGTGGWPLRPARTLLDGHVAGQRPVALTNLCC